MHRRAFVALALMLAGCLSAPRGEPEERPDAGAPGDVEAEEDAALPVEGSPDAGAIAPCSERLPGIASVEDPDTGHCYFVGSRVDYYEVAAQDCAAVGAHVVHLSEAEATFVAEQLLIVDASWWIGLRHAEEEDAWRWVTGEALGPWDAFGEGQPSGDSECVELFIDPTGECAGGCWNDLFCSQHKKGAVCELEP